MMMMMMIIAIEVVVTMIMTMMIDDSNARQTLSDTHPRRKKRSQGRIFG